MQFMLYETMSTSRFGGQDRGLKQRVVVLDAFLKMIRYEGLYRFYKGMSTKIVQSVLFMIKDELAKGAKLLLSNGKLNDST
ncbi:hypothetical protein CARUB_v10027466mg [Capsella rubella]|uniref:ADP,ATP carrier protein n=1 Tax=Capsella rubella TaxID=81985 RepID=R0GCB0_9BRAS|nr:hypothetical protein CARUB_v10027466mg [Capsella rubella]